MCGSIILSLYVYVSNDTTFNTLMLLFQNYLICNKLDYAMNEIELK